MANRPDGLVNARRSAAGFASLLAGALPMSALAASALSTAVLTTAELPPRVRPAPTAVSALPPTRPQPPPRPALIDRVHAPPRGSPAVISGTRSRRRD